MPYQLETVTEVKYGNFRITYPEQSYLVGLNFLNAAEEELLFSFSDRINYSNSLGPLTKLQFKLDGEDFYRYSIEINSSRRVVCRVLMDDGITTLFVSQPTVEIPLNFFSLAEDEIFNPYCQVICSQSCLCLILFKLDEDLKENCFLFSVGSLVNVNEEYGYFSSKVINHSYTLVGGRDIETVINYYSARKRQEFLKNSIFAEYPLICEDTSLKPKSTWLSDLVMYDSREQIGYPYVGLIDESLRVSLNTSTGTFKTMEITSYNGNTYIPLPIFFNKKRLFLRT